MKTVADFKRRIKPGVKLHCVYHQATNGRDQSGKLILTDEDKGVRSVNIVQTNQFTLLTTKQNGEIVDSWINFPKASQCKIIDDNTILYLDVDFRERDKEVLIPLWKGRIYQTWKNTGLATGL